MQYTKIGFFTLLLQSTVLMAQDCDHTRRWWLNLGAGIGNASSDYANDLNNLNSEGASQLSFNGMITDNLFMTLGWTGIYNNDNWDKDNEVRELGLLLGYKSKRPNWYWSAATGVGASRYETQYRVYNSSNYYYYSYKATESTTYFAVPVEGQLFWTPFKHFGIGLVGHASVSKNPFATAMLALQFS